ncbi:MAG: ribbon-helix-helix protein, CopG family [Deltaproteobacteria bacterium]|jgi:predicted transcriptional regulator|nr:ribbon-helix-helix protein, CopG family [Rudaea sp.]
MKTERVTLLISPDDKRRFQNLAEDRGITTSELVRQAVHAFGTASVDEAHELAALTRELRQTIPDMRRSLRDANAAAERAIAVLRGDNPQHRVAEPRARRRVGKR